MLLEVTEESLNRAIAAALKGRTIGDIGHAVESYVVPLGYGIVRDYTGHGAFHKANGGFLVLDAEKVLMNFMSWEAIKRLLRTQEASIENLGEQYGAIPVSSLRPSPIRMDLKIVMIGMPYIYELLQYYDPEFRKLFKIKASFDTDMPRTAATERRMGLCVRDILRRENLKPFDAETLSEVRPEPGSDGSDRSCPEQARRSG